MKIRVGIIAFAIVALAAAVCILIIGYKKQNASDQRVDNTEKVQAVNTPEESISSGYTALNEVSSDKRECDDCLLPVDFATLLFSYKSDGVNEKTYLYADADKDSVETYAEDLAATGYEIELTDDGEDSCSYSLTSEDTVIDLVYDKGGLTIRVTITDD